MSAQHNSEYFIIYPLNLTSVCMCLNLTCLYICVFLCCRELQQGADKMTQGLHTPPSEEEEEEDKYLVPFSQATPIEIERKGQWGII